MKIPMKISTPGVKRLIAVAVAGVFLAGCSAGMTKPDGADDARMKLTRLQSDPQLATRAPVAIKEAEAAVRAAEEPQSDGALASHLVLIADRKVEIASAQAQSRLLIDQRKALGEQREAARLDSRTREADQARGDATSARRDADAARQETDDLQAQIAALNARETDRGLVITLGDLLFATGKADLRGGATGHLDRLAAFLGEYQDRSVLIEGHTDSVGSAEYNLGLSQRRAESVKRYLTGRGVAASRLDTSGKGLGSPVASNDTATGRQQNRRVEVIISSAEVSSN
jgi:outer membrane protein OmpA-like peptidoglycan-associated protein